MTEDVLIPPEQTSEIGAFGRLFRMFTSPVAVFADIARRPGIVAPLLAVSLLLASMYGIRNAHYDAEGELRKRYVTAGFSDAKVEEAIARRERLHIAAATYVAGAVLGPLFYFVVGGLLFLGSRLAGATQGRYLSVASVSLHCAWTTMLLRLGFTILALAGRASLSADDLARAVPTSLAYFATENASRVDLAFLQSLDFLMFFNLALSTIGLAIVTKIPRLRAFLIVAFLQVFSVTIGLSVELSLEFLKRLHH